MNTPSPRAFDDASDSDYTALETLLTHLIDQAHFDFRPRRHPRTSPIHIEAAELLQIAREQLVTTLEEARRHIDGNGD